MLRLLLAFISWVGAGALYLIPPGISGETMYQSYESAPASGGFVLLIVLGLYWFYTGLDAVLRRRRRQRRARARTAQPPLPDRNVAYLGVRFPDPQRRQRSMYRLYGQDTDGLNREWPIGDPPGRITPSTRS